MESLKDHEKFSLSSYIHAWADGIEVEYFQGTFNQAGTVWKKVEFSHNWKAGCDFKYRLKTKTIKIGNIEVPEPMRVAPPVGVTFWAPELGEGVPSAFVGKWADRPVYLLLLASGLCHSSRAAAIVHAKALFDLTKQAMG